MFMRELRIKNFKGLRDIALEASRFCCVIGENNAGKSSIMQALMRLLDGKKIDRSHFYDSQKPVEIRAEFFAIDDADLARLGPAHRPKIKDLVVDGKLTILRRFQPSGESELRIVRLLPKDPALHREAFEELLRGKRAPALAEVAWARFPVLRDTLSSTSNKEACVEAMVLQVDADPSVERVEGEDLPTGIDAPIKGWLPEPIYVPAVRDLSDDIKTKDGASFGKLLSLVLEQLKETETIKKFEEAFSLLDQAINAGTSRLPELTRLEKRLDLLLKEQFARAAITLRFPMPDLRGLLASGLIEVDDGVKAEASTKGDGLRRALTFALIRALVESQLLKTDEDNPARGRYVFLFEEPELYLHPSAQRTLFRALAAVSISQQVFVTTHSPLFFDASATTTFIKLTKDEGGDGPPAARSTQVVLTDLTQRERIQTICFENNSIAFFARTVVLVEGISDAVVFPHIARLVLDESPFERPGVAICRVEGKSSIKKYRDFFASFNVGVFVLADLDCLLDEFGRLGASPTSSALREKLLTLVDVRISAAENSTVSGEKLKEGSKKTTWKERWTDLEQTYAAMSAGKATVDEVKAAGERFFSLERELHRRRYLEADATTEIVAAKRALLAALRDDGIFLLEKGAIEAYYPAGVSGGDKVSKALSFQALVQTRETALELSDEISLDGKSEREFVVVFGSLLAQMKQMSRPSGLS